MAKRVPNRDYHFKLFTSLRSMGSVYLEHVPRCSSSFSEKTRILFFVVFFLRLLFIISRRDEILSASGAQCEWWLLSRGGGTLKLS